MEIGKIYNLESNGAVSQDTWVAWTADNDKVHYVPLNEGVKTYDSYTELTYNLDSSLDTTSSDLQYQVVFYTGTGKITDMLYKIEVNGEEYAFTDLIDDDNDANITLDQELDEAAIGMMLPKSGTIKFYLKYSQSINLIAFNVTGIDQVGPIIPYFSNTWSSLNIFNFDSENTAKQIYYSFNDLGYGMLGIMYAPYATIYVNDIDTDSMYLGTGYNNDNITIDGGYS